MRQSPTAFFCKPFDDGNAFCVKVIAWDLDEAFAVYAKDWHSLSAARRRCRVQ
jgi:hypothetical protein